MRVCSNCEAPAPRSTGRNGWRTRFRGWSRRQSARSTPCAPTSCASGRWKRESIRGSANWRRTRRLACSPAASGAGSRSSLKRCGRDCGGNSRVLWSDGGRRMSRRSTGCVRPPGASSTGVTSLRAGGARTSIGRQRLTSSPTVSSGWPHWFSTAARVICCDGVWRPLSSCRTGSAAAGNSAERQAARTPGGRPAIGRRSLTSWRRGWSCCCAT